MSGITVPPTDELYQRIVELCNKSQTGITRAELGELSEKVDQLRGIIEKYPNVLDARQRSGIDKVHEWLHQPAANPVQQKSSWKTDLVARACIAGASCAIFGVKRGLTGALLALVISNLNVNNFIGAISYVWGSLSRIP